MYFQLRLDEILYNFNILFANPSVDPGRLFLIEILRDIITLLQQPETKWRSVEIIMKLICRSPFTALSAISQVGLKKRQQQHLKT